MSCLNTWMDACMAAGPVKRYRQRNPLAEKMRWVQTSAGVVRVFDSGGDKARVVMSPDGLNAIAHYAGLFALLTPHVRVAQGLLRESVNATLGTHTPCTVLWGVQDRSHSVTDPQPVLRGVSQAEVIVFDDCGHFPDLENPQRFAQILLAQVTGVLSAKLGSHNEVNSAFV